MISADWIAIAIMLGAIALGALVGFGKGLQIFTGGPIGVIISVIVCYCFGGFFLEITFIQDLLNKLASLWTEQAGIFYDFLTKIHPEIIIYYIVLFIVVQIIRIVIVKIIAHVAETKNTVIKVINKTLGAAMFAAMAVLISLIVFQVIYWVGGETAEQFANDLAGSVFKLDELFLNNPLLQLVNMIKNAAGI